MPIPVKLSEVVDEMSMSGDEISTYLNRVTGEMVTVTAEERRAAEDPEDWDLLPGWQQEVMPQDPGGCRLRGLPQTAREVPDPRVVHHGAVRLLRGRRSSK
jgi:hypothetical protein